jgi:hypothetical protein
MPLLLHSKLLAKAIKIPTLELVLASPQVRHHTHSVSTKAYAVEVVLSEDSTGAHVLQVLQTLLVCATPEFVP